MQDNLPELRDIHLPDGVSIFPPAYGWFVILIFIISLYFLYQGIVLLRKKSKKLYALRFLNNLSDTDIVGSAKEISIILRRICVFKYSQAVVLTGADWIDFLNAHCKNKLLGKPASLLNDAPYISSNSNTYNQQDFEDLKKYASQWIGENL